MVDTTQEPRPTTLIGAVVVDTDGEEIGRVADEAGGYLEIDCPGQAAFWLNTATARIAEADRVELDFAREHLDIFSMDTPGFLPGGEQEDVESRLEMARSGTLPQIQGHDALTRSAELMDSVLESDPEPDPVAWGHQLRHATRLYFEAVKQHRDATEAEGGALDALALIKPALMRQLDRQRREHHELLLKAEELEDEVREQLAFARLDTDTARIAALVLRESLRLHMYRATNLLYEAYFQEEGGEEG